MKVEKQPDENKCFDDISAIADKIAKHQNVMLHGPLYL